MSRNTADSPNFLRNVLLCALVFSFLSFYVLGLQNLHTVFPHIVSAFEKVPPLNSYCGKNSVYQVRNLNIAATVQIGSDFQIQKRIPSLNSSSITF